MKVVILCGGQGTRLREETEFRPKPMVEIGGRPILWHILKIYAHHGFQDFVLCLGYRGHAIKEYFLNYEAMSNDFTISLGRRQQIEFHGHHGEEDLRVTLADTGLETMTGGRIRRAFRYVDGTFMLTYGDGVADIDVARLVEFHRSHGKLATVTVVRPSSRFGLANLSDDDRVVSFAEKPLLDGWVSAGFFVLEPGIIDYLQGGDACVFEREPLERLAGDGQLAAYRHHGFFAPMDTYRDVRMLNDAWSTGEPPWKIWQ